MSNNSTNTQNTHRPQYPGGRPRPPLTINPSITSASNSVESTTSASNSAECTTPTNQPINNIYTNCWAPKTQN